MDETGYSTEPFSDSGTERIVSQVGWDEAQAGKKMYIATGPGFSRSCLDDDPLFSPLFHDSQCYERIIMNEAGGGTSFAIDPVNQQVYVMFKTSTPPTFESKPTLKRADLDGSNIETLGTRVKINIP